MNQPATFHNVWLRRKRNTWLRWNLLAYDDIGLLKVEDNQLQFIGRSHHFTISLIDELGFGTQGRDFINNWIHIGTGAETMFFADGGWWGWKGRIADGTRKILKAIINAFPERAGQDSTPQRCVSHL